MANNNPKPVPVVTKKRKGRGCLLWLLLLIGVGVIGYLNKAYERIPIVKDLVAQPTVTAVPPTVTPIPTPTIASAFGATGTVSQETAIAGARSTLEAFATSTPLRPTAAATRLPATVTPTIEATLPATRIPTPTPTNVPAANPVLRLFIPEIVPVSPGGTTQVRITYITNTSCTLSYSGSGTPSGQGAQTTDRNGGAIWNLQFDAKTPKGTGQVRVSCGPGPEQNATAPLVIG